MNIEPTEYTGEHAGWVHTFHLHTRGWSVRRIKIGATNIPPFMQFFTVNGWEAALKLQSNLRHFDKVEDAIYWVEEDENA